MEDGRATVTNRHGKRKIHPLGSLTIGGEGGIAGLLVFGGALAIAGFMAVASFATSKNKTKGNTHHHQPKPQQKLLHDDMCKGEDNHDTTQSLSSLLQHSTTQVEVGDVTCCCSCWTSNMSINPVRSSEVLSAQPLILEGKIDHKLDGVEESPTCFHHQEIAFSDCSHPGSAASSNENGVAEECSVSLFNNSIGHEQEEEKDEDQDGLTSTETEDDDIDEEDDDDDMKSDDVTETDEEDSSKATGTTSLDYNEEPVWPVELIQEPEQEFKRGYCESHVCGDSDADGSHYAIPKETSSNKKASFAVVPRYQPTILTTWVIPILLLALLLLLVLLTRSPQESFYVLDDGESVIVP